jgi:hypothetical protein
VAQQTSQADANCGELVRQYPTGKSSRRGAELAHMVCAHTDRSSCSEKVNAGRANAASPEGFFRGGLASPVTGVVGQDASQDRWADEMQSADIIYH